MLAAPGLPTPTLPREAIEARRRELLALGMIEYEDCRRSGLYYLEYYGGTYDEHEREEPSKPLFHGKPLIDRVTLQPTRELDGSEDDYLRYIALAWLKEKLLLVPKSRQLRLSHLMVNLHGWLCQFYPGQKVAIQSKVFEAADALLERRLQSMKLEREKYPHIPWPDANGTDGYHPWPNGQPMMAIKQGGDKVRSYTFSAIMSDEMAFQEEAEEAYVAAIPTIEGGDAKYTGISTANPGFFQTLVFDKAGAR